MAPTLIPTDALPLYSWAPDLEDSALEQALNCATLPCAHSHVSLMADAHMGYGVPIGAVLALKNAISPYAVGNDIGCGMAVLRTTLHVDDLLTALPTRSGNQNGEIGRDYVMGSVMRSIPSGMAGHATPIITPDLDACLSDAYDAMEDAAALTGVPLAAGDSPKPEKFRPLTRDAFTQRGRSQAGTLGSGNHFVELLQGPDGDVWLMLHSGSRGVGSAICNNFHRMALAYCDNAGYVLPDTGLAWLPISTGGHAEQWEQVGQLYTLALGCGLDFAATNRQRMLTAVAEIIERKYPGAVEWDTLVNIHHNDATLETHDGVDVWVHRKGAVNASAGTATITPGSMGTGSYLGVGLGNPESFHSASHGAGRVMSRGRARRELSLEHELASIKSAGGKVYAASKEAVHDEMPGAYKDLEGVMANQADLVQTVRRFTPLGTYKGADVRGKRRQAPTAGDAPEM